MPTQRMPHKPIITKRVVLVGIGLATLLKLYLAATTGGTLDVAGYSDQLVKIRQLGGVGAYHVRGAFNNPFNHPPFMIHFLKALGFLSDLTGISFGFWLRLFPSLADIGSLIVIWNMPALRASRRIGGGLLLLLALCPTSIIISGYHGNTDPIFIFFVLLAIFLLEARQRTLFAGLAFGMALNIKAVPLMLLPGFFFYLWPDLKNELKFVGAATLVFLLGSLPYLLQDPGIIAKVVFGYSSIYGKWGWSLLAVLIYPDPPQFLHPPYDVIGIHAYFAAVGKWLLLGLIVAISFRINQGNRKPALLYQVGLIIAIFLTATPGFGSQYLVWMVPFILSLGQRVAATYYAVTAVYLLLSYTCVGNQFFYCNIFVLFFAVLVTWGEVIAVLISYRRAYEGFKT